MPDTSIKKAVEILRRGGLVAFPTETVYGLGADAANDEAVHAIFRAKERPSNHPLIVHIPDIKQLSEWAEEISDNAYELAKTFWPGPLTIILKKRTNVSDKITGGQETIGLRIPNHPVALHLLNAFGGGIAAPSANRFTHLSPTTAKAVDEELPGKVDLILNGGACDVGVESTIIDMSGEIPTILRPGMITANEIAKILKKTVRTAFNSAHRAPGMHHLHYAPVTKTSLMTKETLENFHQSFFNEESIFAIMVYDANINSNQHFHVIQMPKNAENYAHDLYQTLRKLDHENFQQILIERVPDGEVWDAIRDRLFKATGSIKELK